MRAVWVKLVDSNVFFIVRENVVMLLDLRVELSKENLVKKLSEESLVFIDTKGRLVDEIATGYIKYSLCYDDTVGLLDEQKGYYRL